MSFLVVIRIDEDGYGHPLAAWHRENLEEEGLTTNGVSTDCLAYDFSLSVELADNTAIIEVENVDDVFDCDLVERCLHAGIRPSSELGKGQAKPLTLDKLPALDVKARVLGTLKAAGCTLSESQGIVKVTTPTGEVWDFTTPQEAGAVERESMLEHFVVLYTNNSQTEGEDPFGFKCQAEGRDHAEEQCVNAYPDAEVVYVHAGEHYSDALAAYDEP